MYHFLPLLHYFSYLDHSLKGIGLAKRGQDNGGSTVYSNPQPNLITPLGQSMLWSFMMCGFLHVCRKVFKGLLDLAKRKDVSLSQSVAIDRYQIKCEELML